MTPRIGAAMTELIEAVIEAVQAEAVEARTPDRLLSISEAAQTLGVGRTTAYNEIEAGRLPSVKVGRRRLVPSSAISSYIANR